MLEKICKLENSALKSNIEMALFVTVASAGAISRAFAPTYTTTSEECISRIFRKEKKNEAQKRELRNSLVEREERREF